MHAGQNWHLRYAATAFLAGLPLYGLMVILPGTSYPLSFGSPAILALAFGCTSVLVAYLIRGFIVREASLILVAALGYVVGSVTLFPVWMVLEQLTALVSGVPVKTLLAWGWGEGLLTGVKLGVISAIPAGLLAIPYCCFLVWLLRKQSSTVTDNTRAGRPEVVLMLMLVIIVVGALWMFFRTWIPS